MKKKYSFLLSSMNNIKNNITHFNFTTSFFLFWKVWRFIFVYINIYVVVVEHIQVIVVVFCVVHKTYHIKYTCMLFVVYVLFIVNIHVVFVDLFVLTKKNVIIVIYECWLLLIKRGKNGALIEFYTPKLNRTPFLYFFLVKLGSKFR